MGAMENSPLEFPCDYPLMVMGRHTPEFRERVLAVLAERIGPLRDERVSERASRAGNYVALTCTVHAESRAHLDEMYRALHATGLVLYAL
jgi:uncharacterized protein